MSNAQQQYKSSNSSSGSRKLLSGSRQRQIPWLVRHLLYIMLLATLMQLPEARHAHRHGSGHVAAAAAAAYDELPAWNVDPHYGLQQSADQDSQDESSLSVDSDSDSDESYSDSHSEESYQAKQAALQEYRHRQRDRHRRESMCHFVGSAVALPPAWENPCGGELISTEPSPSKDHSVSKSNRIKIKDLTKLRNITAAKYENIWHHYGNNIDVDIEAFKFEYAFLPNLTSPAKKIKLKTWYRDIQTFVAGFAELERLRCTFRKQNQLNLSGVKELHDLMANAKSMLCELQIAINSSYPHNNIAKLSLVSRSEMEERLKFHTPTDGSQDTDVRDLKFSKQLYLKYLKYMWNTLDKQTKRRQHRKSMESSGSKQSFDRSIGAAAAAAAAAEAAANADVSSASSAS